MASVISAAFCTEGAPDIIDLARQLNNGAEVRRCTPYPPTPAALGRYPPMDRSVGIKPPQLGVPVAPRERHPCPLSLREMIVERKLTLL